MSERADITVEVDRDLCISAGDCVRRAAAVFALGADGRAYVLDPAAADLATLRAAERSCPSGAISVTTLE
jgi:ferredoxin